MADDGKKQSRFDLFIGAIDGYSKTFDGWTGRMDKGKECVERFQKSMHGLNDATGLSRLTGSVGNLVGKVQNVKDEGANLLGNITGWVGKLSILFGAAGGGAFALAHSTANAGDAAAKAAARAGVGIKTWQEYAYAASLSDVSNERLEKSFVDLQDIAIKAFKGDKTNANLLKMVGIDPKTAKGEVKNADTMMMELADKVKKLQDAGQGGKAANLLTTVLGDRAKELMPLLQGGSEGMKQMRLEAHKLGIVMSEDDAKASEAFNDGITRLLATGRGFGTAIGTKVLPPLTKLMERFTEWGGAQRELVTGGLVEWIESLDIESVWKGFQDGVGVVRSFISTVDDVAQAFGGWKNVAMALGALIAGKFIMSLGSVALAFGQVGLAILTTPVGWFLGACALIGGAVYAIYKNWDNIVSYFSGLWQGVKDAFASSWTEGIVKMLWNFFPARLISKGMLELFNYFTGIDLIEYGSNIVDSFGQGISQRWQELMQWFQGKVQKFTEAWNKVKGFFGAGDDSTSTVTMEDSGAFPAGKPMNIGPAARAIAETRTEHVEKNEVVVKLQTEAGVNASVHGNGGEGVSLQTGYLNAAGY